MPSSAYQPTFSTPLQSQPAYSFSAPTKYEGSHGTVLIVDGSRRFTKGHNQNQMSTEDVDAIVTAVQIKTGSDGVQARVVDHLEIKENGWDLNIGRYLTTEAAEALDVTAALGALRAAQLAFREAEDQLEERLKAAGYA